MVSRLVSRCSIFIELEVLFASSSFPLVYCCIIKFSSVSVSAHQVHLADFWVKLQELKRKTVFESQPVLWLQWHFHFLLSGPRLPVMWPRFGRTGRHTLVHVISSSNTTLHQSEGCVTHISTTEHVWVTLHQHAITVWDCYFILSSVLLF